MAALELPPQRPRSRPSTGGSRDRRGANGWTASPAGAPLSCPLRRQSTRQTGARTAFAPTRARRPQRRVLVLSERVRIRPQKIPHRARQELIGRRERPPNKLQRRRRVSLQLSTMPTRIVFIRRSRLRYRHRYDLQRLPRSRQREFLQASTTNRVLMMCTLRPRTIPTA